MRCLEDSTNKGLLIKTQADNRTQRIPAMHITDLDFADDLIVPSSTIRDAEALFHPQRRCCVRGPLLQQIDILSSQKLKTEQTRPCI